MRNFWNNWTCKQYQKKCIIISDMQSAIIIILKSTTKANTKYKFDYIKAYMK